MILKFVYLLKVLKAAIKSSVDCPALYLSYFHFKSPDIPCIIIISSLILKYKDQKVFIIVQTADNNVGLDLSAVPKALIFQL